MFCNFLLADEINRAPAKVQSALLEVMQERQVTLGHTTHPVPDPFLVMATQNPIESEGTYPLPEAQVDRFMLKILVDYPLHDEELTVIQRSLVAPPELDAAALDRGAPRACRQAVRGDLRRPGPRQLRARSSRPRRAARPSSGCPTSRRFISFGASPRGPISLIHAARGARRRARARLRAGAGSAGADQGRAAPPARALVRGARRAAEPRQPARRDRRRRARCRSSTSPGTRRDRRAPPPRADPGAARARARCRSRCCARST